MRYLILITTVIFTSGCGLELLMGAAIQGQAQKEAMSGAKQTIDYAQDASSRISIEQAITAYYAETGEYPHSLEALTPEWLPRIPEKADGTSFGYDPATGKLLDGPVASEVANGTAEPPGLLDRVPLEESNQERLIRIHEAITHYTQEQRRYPPSLQALVPDYLSAPIKTRDGQDFAYDPTTGIVSVPPPLPEPLGSRTPTADLSEGYGQHTQPQAQPQRRAPAAGGGPMGEALTGIGIQQELQRSMGGGGAAGTARQRMRGQTDQAIEQRNRQQEEALRELVP